MRGCYLSGAPEFGILPYCNTCYVMVGIIQNTCYVMRDHLAIRRDMREIIQCKDQNFISVHSFGEFGNENISRMIRKQGKF